MYTQKEKKKVLYTLRSMEILGQDNLRVLNPIPPATEDGWSVYTGDLERTIVALVERMVVGMVWNYIPAI